MSRCRWSSMDWKCDLYIYDSEHGIEVNVAANRRVGPLPVTPWILDVPEDEWVAAMAIERAALDSAPTVPIGGLHDGDSFTLGTERELADLLVTLRSEGYVFPDRLANEGATK